MSLQHRPTSSDPGYQPISQEEIDTNERRPLTQTLEEEEEALEEEFVSQEHVAEHDRRIYWIHVILGSAVLLPWNGKHQQCSRPMNNTLTSSL